MGRRVEEDYDVTSQAIGKGMSGAAVLATPKQGRMVCRSTSTCSVGSSNTTKDEQDWVVIKTLQKKGLSPKALKFLLSEVFIYLKMDHPNIVRLLQVYETQQDVTLVMEYCSGGSLADRLVSLGNFSEAAALDATKQILMAVQYCHNHPQGRVCHRDIKHANCVYAFEDELAPLKLVDFGLSQILPVTDKRFITGRAGTLHYMAPEVVADKVYNESCDLWSVGVVTWCLLFGTPPFDAEKPKLIEQAILKGDLGPMTGPPFTGTSWACKDFLRRLLTVNPAMRPSAEQALQHPWITSGRTHSANRICRNVLEKVRNFAHVNEIGRAVASLAVYSGLLPNGTDVKHLENQFRALDVDGSGTVSMQELADAFRTQLDVSENESHWIFRQLDTDGDEGIHISEFLAAATGAQLLGCDETCRESFARFDVDGDGRIELSELESVIGKKFCGQPTREILEKYDTDGDRTIDFSEFSAAVAVVPPPTPNSSQVRTSCSISSDVTL